MIWYTWKWWRFAWGKGKRTRKSDSGSHVIDVDGLWVWVASGLFWLRNVEPHRKESGK